MRIHPLRFFGVGVAAVALTFAATNHGQIGLAQQAAKIRWDIVTFTSFSPPTFKDGGATFSWAIDGNYIKVTGSGTFGPGLTDPVTGGGEWETFDVHNKSTGKGKYTVTRLVSWQEAPGTLPAALIDNIAPKAAARAGLAVVLVAYANADGSSGGTGTLVISCHLPEGSPHSMFEGVIPTKDFVTFYAPVAPMPGVDANRTVFHRVTM